MLIPGIKLRVIVSYPISSIEAHLQNHRPFSCPVYHANIIWELYRHAEPGLELKTYETIASNLSHRNSFYIILFYFYFGPLSSDLFLLYFLYIIIIMTASSWNVFLGIFFPWDPSSLCHDMVKTASDIMKREKYFLFIAVWLRQLLKLRGER